MPNTKCVTDIYLELTNIIDILIMRDRKLIHRISVAMISSSSTHALLVASGRDLAVLCGGTDGWEIAPPLFRRGGGHILRSGGGDPVVDPAAMHLGYLQGDLEDLGSWVWLT